MLSGRRRLLVKEVQSGYVWWLGGVCHETQDRTTLKEIIR